MARLAILLTLAVLATVALAQKSCANPIVPSGVGSQYYFTVSQPVANVPGSSFCPGLINTCCNSSIFAVLKEVFTSLDTSLSQGFTQLDQQMPQLQQALDQASAQIDASSQFTANQKAAFKKFIAAAKTFYSGFAQNCRLCFSGILRYIAGMYCFACNGDWNQYVTSNGTIITVQLAVNTCNKVADSCTPLFNSLSTLLQAYVDLQIQITGSSGSATAPNPCNGGSCRDYICGTLIAGDSANTGAALQTAPSFGRKRSELDVNAASQFASELTDYAVYLGSYYDTNMVAPVRRSMAAATAANTYTSSGYDSYSVGSQSGMQSATFTVQPSAASSMTVTAASLVLAALLALVL